MQIADILLNKGTEVHTIEPTASLAAAIAKFAHHNIGSLVVCELRRPNKTAIPMGLIDERDVLRALARNPRGLAELCVEDVMVAHWKGVSPAEDVEQAMSMMTEMRVRHLMCLEHGMLCGIISIGDVVKACTNELSAENELLHRYILGESATPAMPPNATEPE
jgi:CBS domain-containing protein